MEMTMVSRGFIKFTSDFGLDDITVLSETFVRSFQFNDIESMTNFSIVVDPLRAYLSRLPVMPFAHELRTRMASLKCYYDQIFTP